MAQKTEKAVKIETAKTALEKRSGKNLQAKQAAEAVQENAAVKEAAEAVQGNAAVKEPKAANAG
jgi:hypothetical protein